MVESVCIFAESKRANVCVERKSERASVCLPAQIGRACHCVATRCTLTYTQTQVNEVVRSKKNFKFIARRFLRVLG